MKNIINYDSVDIEIIDALIEGMRQYEKSAEERASDIKRDTAVSATMKKKELRRLAQFGRI